MQKVSREASKYIAAAKKAIAKGAEAPLFPLSNKPKAANMATVPGAKFQADGLDVEVFKGKTPSTPVYLKETGKDGTQWFKINAQLGYDVF
jgi:hypothetical protein